MAHKDSMRQKYIDSIMKSKYGSDNPKYDSQNLAFLETLSLSELAHLADNEFEDEFDIEGEVLDVDFDGEELSEI